jgi:hypothetical protein
MSKRVNRAARVGIHAVIKPTVSHDKIAALSIETKANLAYDVLSGIATQLEDVGIDPDLVASAAWDLGHELIRRDGSPPRVFRLNSKPVQKIV